MKDIKICNYSVYSDGCFGSECLNFLKLYHGVRVSVDNRNGDSKYMHFSIRKKKTKDCIWKRGCERMDALVFDDESCSITCDFENEKENKTPHTLFFEDEVYFELKENIPLYMKECGCKFEILEDSKKTQLLF